MNERNIFHAHSTHFFKKIYPGEMTIWRMSSRSTGSGRCGDRDTNSPLSNDVNTKRGMVLPFTPLAMSFDSVNYYVDMPPVSRIWSQLFCTSSKVYIFTLSFR